MFISTKIKNLVYKLSTTNKKIYYARYTIDGIKKHVRLSTNMSEARKKLTELKNTLLINQQLPKGLDLDSIVDALKDKLDDSFKISKKSGIIYKELFLEYIEHSATSQSEKELKEKITKHKNKIYEFYLKDLDCEFQNADISDLKYSHFQAVIDKILIIDNLSPKSALNYKNTMVQPMKFAVLQNYLKDNPASFIKIPKFDNKKPFTLNKTDIKNLFKAILTTRDEVFRCIFLLGFHGRRKTEVLNFHINQLDFEANLYRLSPEQNKSTKWFTHIMTDLLHKELKSYCDRFQPDGYLFVNPMTDEPYQDIRRQFNDLKVRAGIEDKNFTFHDFRHLIATIAINELDIATEKAGGPLQHSSVVVTEIYKADNPKASRDVTQAIIDYATDKLTVDYKESDLTQDINDEDLLHLVRKLLLKVA